MPTSTNNGFLITDAGLEAASIAGEFGPYVKITSFKIGSGVNYTPERSQTALNGTELYSSAPTSYTVIDVNTSQIMCIMSNLVGPFMFGEVGLYLEDGTLFAICVWDTLQEKVQAVGAQFGNTWKIRGLLKFAQAPAIVQVTLTTSQNILEVPNLTLLVAPTDQPNDANIVIVHDNLDSENPILVVRNGDYSWGPISYSEIFVGNSTDSGASSTTTSFTHPLLAVTNFELPITGEKYLVRFADGQIRKIIGKPTDTQITWSPGEALPTGQISVWRSPSVTSTNKTSLGGLTVGSVTLNQSLADPGGSPGTYGGRVLIEDTNPNGWNTDAGRMTVEFELTPNNFFAGNPSAHCAIVLRQDPTLMHTPAVTGDVVRGQGIAFGNTTFFPNYANPLNPTAIIETWMGITDLHPLPVPAGIGIFTWPNSEVAHSFALQDGTHYKFSIDSTKTNDGNRYIRYRVWSLQPTYLYWRLEQDSGDVLDHNVWADLTQSSLAFGWVFGSNSAAWSLPFTNVKVTWGPAEHATPDQTIKLSRYGAQLEGDLEFLGNFRRIKLPPIDELHPNRDAAFQSSVLNEDTNVIVIPNGTSQNAAYVAYNTSLDNNIFKGVSFGMVGSEAYLTTWAWNSGIVAPPPLNIDIGLNTRVAQFTSAGLKLLNSSVPVETPIGWSSQLINWGGTNAVTFNTTGNFDIDGICADSGVGFGIRDYLNSLSLSYSPLAIEYVLRPLYCMFSGLIADLKNKKII